MGREIRDKVKHYQFASTESESTYPTDCPKGSDMEIIDEVTHKIIGYKIFDGTNWNDL